MDNSKIQVIFRSKSDDICYLIPYDEFTSNLSSYGQDSLIVGYLENSKHGTNFSSYVLYPSVSRETQNGENENIT